MAAPDGKVIRRSDEVHIARVVVDDGFPGELSVCIHSHKDGGGDAFHHHGDGGSWRYIYGDIHAHVIDSPRPAATLPAVPTEVGE